MLIYELGYGKIDPAQLQKVSTDIHVMVDRNYQFNSACSLPQVEAEVERCIYQGEGDTQFVSMDVLTFLENCKFKADKIKACRFAEHISLSKLPYFIYLLHCSVIREGWLDIIVPDAKYYAEQLLQLNEDIAKGSINFANSLLEITTEFVNEKEDPHGSLWTEKLGTWYLQNEEFFEVKEIREVSIDRRHYLQFLAINV